MLLGFNTNGLPHHRLDDALRLLADSGYRAVAITLDVAHLDPYRCTAREVEATATLLAHLGLHPVIETGARFLLDPAHKHEPTLMTRGAEGRARRIDFLDRAARIGRDLGAEVVSFFAGIDRGPPETAATTLQSGVREACAAIRSHGLTPALEPEPGMAVSTVAEYLALRRSFCGDDGAGAAAAADPRLCLDIGHLYVTGEGDPEVVLPQVAGLLAQVHLEDIRRGVHEHLLPGQGDVDFGIVHESLRSAGWNGPVCFELSRSGHLAPDAIARCRDLWFRLEP